MPAVSIVVRTLNEARYLGQLLDGIRTQRAFELEVETVLVDSAPTDQTTEIAARYPVSALKLRPDQLVRMQAFERLITAAALSD